jgi:diguanylate cyclase (GGDEF)-like protein
MDTAKLLGAIRPTILVLDSYGTVREVHGGASGMLGYQPEDLVGHNALEFVVASQQELIASFFLHSGDEDLSPVLYPVPLRATMITSSGDEALVDVICTGMLDDPEVQGWVAVLIPHQLLTSPYAPLEAIVAGRPTSEVFDLITDSLNADHPDGRLLHAYVLSDPVSGSFARLDGSLDKPRLRASVEALVHGDGMNKWDQLTSPKMLTLTLDMLPYGVADVARGHGYTGARVMPIMVGDEVQAAILCFDSMAHLPLYENMRQRFEHLVGVLEIALSHRASQERLTRAATCDGLTGLANRDRFRAAVDEAISDYTVLYVDIDSFKQVNDTFGHLIGDGVLVEVARRIERVCRPDDVVARLGGDEFAVMLQGADRRMATAIGERLVAAVAEPLPAVLGPAAVTVSVGLARRRDRDSAETVIDLADRAMLAAKRAGRDRLVTAAG